VRNLAQHISIALELADEYAERKRAKEELTKYRDHLEELVKERTAELLRANEQLQRGIAERKRVEEESCRQRDLAEALAEAAAVVSSTLDSDEVLDRILEQVSRVVPNDATNIMLIEGDRARSVRWRGYERFGAGEFISTVIFHLPDVPGLQRMLESREPIVIPDTDVYPDWVHLPVTDWLRSYAAAPIVVRGEAIGFLNVDSAIPGFFTQAHAETLRAFAGHAAVAIENARLYEEAQRRIAELAGLHELSQAFSSVTDVRETYGELAKRMAHLIGCQSCTIATYDHKTREMRAQPPGYGAPDEIVQCFRYKVDGPARNAWNFRLQGPLLANNIVQIPGFFLQWVEGFNLFNLLIVPMTLEGRITGLVYAANKPGGFAERDSKLLTIFAGQAAVIIENARLYEETRRWADEMTSVYNIGVATTSTLNLDEVLKSVCDQVCHLMNVSNFFIALYNAEREELSFELALDEGGLVDKFTRRLVNGGGLSGWIVQSRKPLLLRDIQKEELPIEAIVVGDPARSWLGVPLLYMDWVVGVMGVQSYQPNAFDEDDQQLLSTIAAQVAIAIENARLYEESKRRLGELSTIQEVSMAATSTIDFDQTLEQAADTMQRLLDFQVFGFLLLDERTGELRLHPSYRGVDPAIAERLDLRLGRGITGWVAETGHPLLVPDVSQDSHYLDAIAGIRSEVCVPLKIGQRVIGVIDVESDQLDAFSSEDLQLLTTLAGQLAVTIENAHLFAETEKKANDLALLLGTSTAISSTLDLDQILETVAHQITTSLVATLCRITLLDETRESLVIRAASPIRDKTAEDGFGRRYPLAMAPWHRQVVETSEPVVLRQDVPERTLSDEERRMALTEGVKSAALIPLIVGGRVLGVITLGEERSWERSPFTHEKVELCQSIAAQAAVAIENARLYEELQQSFLQTIAALAAAVDAKDPYTGGHSQRTTELAATIAHELELSSEEIEVIRYAGLLHDVGKIGISEQVLLKPGPLNAEEWEVIHRHPALGASIVERAALLEKLVPVIQHHHEHYDGRGYPMGLRGENIPLAARILAVADAFEAMTSDRAYRPALTVEQALATLREGADKQWDGKIVDVLDKIIREQDH
jgi:putative nucleotidyltransferase with HDIG domain